MNELGTAHCSFCQRPTDEPTFLPPIGTLCPDCLLGGRFLEAGIGPRLSTVVDRLLELSATACAMVAAAVEQAEASARRRHFEEARQLFLEQALKLRQQGRPLLAFALMRRALRLPGPSAQVYLEMALSALCMNCRPEAIQYFKTSSWLALKIGDEATLQLALQQLGQLCPQDGWIDRARGRMAARDLAPNERCRFCGREASVSDQLVLSPDGSAACRECLERLERHRLREG